MLAVFPLFLFSPVQAFLLPSLTAAERGEAERVRQQIRTVLVAVGSVGLVSAVGAALAVT